VALHNHHSAWRGTLSPLVLCASITIASVAVAGHGHLPGGVRLKGDVGEARAHWLAADTLAWSVAEDSSVTLHYSSDAKLVVTPAGLAGADGVIELQRHGVLGGAEAAKFRHLEGMPVYRIAVNDLAAVAQILRGQFALAATDAAGRPVDATGIQPAGVLDDLYTYEGDLGVSWNDRVPTIRVWAPTAKSVKLHLFADANEASPAVDVIDLVRDAAGGTWSIEGDAGWDRMYYLYEVEVYARFAAAIETFLVTDPYSLGLSKDSRRSQIVNLDDADLKPKKWDTLNKPPLAAPEDIAIYELHVRDFSMHDDTVPAKTRGTFAAFGLENSHGAKHLRGLANAGLTHVHLLPVFDCATIPEDRNTQKGPGDLSSFAPDGTEQQAAIGAIRDEDGFNWCYDPYHYTVPEGSYATNADGPQRILEFREMVASLGELGLRVVMDVVYNHTSDSLGGAQSVLDKIVPDYYHRLDDAGHVEMSSCCANTATEHNMMEKLMLDSLRTWATAYKVDGFRFDLMGHHTRTNIEKARDMLSSLTVAGDGVDGAAIYLYGEGWNFGEVANDARFVQATQRNMGAGTGVGSFNDRLRDGLRGGGPFDTGDAHVRRQGFINGLYYDPNALNSGAGTEREELLRLADWVRLGLAGTLSEYVFTDSNGNYVKGSEMDYFGNPGAGYASDPQEVINYAAAHDNETLFDISQYKLPIGTSLADRVRVVNLANSIVALSQGVPLFHAGQDMLRSKSMDRNSYNSGDWFNVLDFSYAINGWGRGLPPADDNEASWAEIEPLLANPSLAEIDRKHITAAAKHLREMLRIRNASPLFRLRTGAEIMDRLEFHNTGPEQVPGLVVMSLRGDEDVEVVVLFNATTVSQAFYLDTGSDGGFALHPVQRESHDPVVRTASYADHAFTVPARTTAVFVAD
jgi:pullulanase-type alpha-1,6-glucosidase